MKKYMTLIILVTIITLILTSSVLALVEDTVIEPPNGEDPPTKGNNGLGNGVDGQPPGNPPINDNEGNSPGNPGNKGKNK